jgi:hypothetical protein
MRRTVLRAAVLWAIIAGPLVPHLHLAAVPHRYCASHGEFEEVHPHPAPVGSPGDEDDPGPPEQEHEPCLLATLLLAHASHERAVLVVCERLVPTPDRLLQVSRIPPPRSQELVSLAPKNSPPAPAPV